ncbi:F-box domain containing protein [Pandoravirus japonicus]|uniref:F-box domain containing protein n=1 Tax=Pandoravirus japonicus TaxID=2823154 RepID=A0A811BSG1_9VIRU|nr:F-box domain containing protein [Pandoravirus japonicus]
MLEVARQRRHRVYPANGRYVGVVPSSDDTSHESGEWGVALVGQDTKPQLVLNGYATATCVNPPKGDAVKKGAHGVDIRSREGLWRAGAFVGPGRVIGHMDSQYRAERFGPRGIDGHGEAAHGNDRYIGLSNGLHGRGASGLVPRAARYALTFFSRFFVSSPPMYLHDATWPNKGVPKPPCQL